jgi:hypothetical protein
MNRRDLITTTAILGTFCLAFVGQIASHGVSAAPQVSAPSAQAKTPAPPKKVAAPPPTRRTSTVTVKRGGKSETYDVPRLGK